MKAFQYLAALGLGAAVTLGETALPVAAQTDPVEASAEIKASEQITASAIALVPDVQPFTPSNPVVTEQPSVALEVVEAPANIETAVPLEVLPAGTPPANSATPAIAQVEAAPPVEAPAVEEALDQTGITPSAPPTVPEAPSQPELVTPEPELPSVDGPSEPVVEPTQPRLDTPESPAPLETPDTDDASVPVDSDGIDPVEAEFNQEGNNAPANSTPADAIEAAPNDGLSESTETTATPEMEAEEEGVVAESDASATTLVDEQPNLFRPDETDEVSITVNEAISLDQAIEIARQNNPGIRVRQLQLEQSQTAVDEARAAYAPQFSVNGSFDNSGTITTTDELYREPDFGQDNDSNARDATVSLAGNARVDYGIIDPDRKARVNAAKIAADQAKLTLEQELADLRLTVSQAYYQLQEADEQVDISEQAVISAQRSLKDAQALEKAGVGTRFSVLQADVQLANEQQNLVNNLSAQQQSRRQLAQVLSTPEKLNLTASDPVASAGTWNMTLETSIIRAYQNRVELDNQLLQRDLSDAQRGIVLATTRPSLTAFAQAGPGLRWDFNRTNPDDSDDTTSGIQRGTLGYQAGLRFQWLFGDGGATKAAARQQALNKAIADENFEAARDQVRREVEDAFYDLAANLRNIDTSEKGVVQADEALRLARLRFQAGVGTQSEVVDAERDLTTAQGNRVSAVLNYNRALVAIQRAIGETLVAPELEIPVYVDGEG